jgi:hypothetical protein
LIPIARSECLNLNMSSFEKRCVVNRFVFHRAQGIAVLETGVEDCQRRSTDVQCYSGKQWANDAICGDPEQVSCGLSSL